MAEFQANPTETPPAVALSEEEMTLKFRPVPVAAGSEGISSSTFAAALPDLSLPQDDEGFDTVEYIWSGKEDSASHLKKWVLDRKLSVKLDDVQPGEWFKKLWKEWQEDLRGWYLKQMEFKSSAKSRQQDDQQNHSKDVQRQNLDIFGVSNVCDVDGEPLFAAFNVEDWAILGLRYELHLLCHAVPRSLLELTGISVPGIHPNNISFYYSKFYKKALSLDTFGVDDITALVDLVKDTVVIGRRSGALESHLPADIGENAVFVRLAEESRRDRHRRIHIGDPTAELKFTGTVSSAAFSAAGGTNLKPLLPAGAVAAPASGAAASIRPVRPVTTMAPRVPTLAPRLPKVAPAPRLPTVFAPRTPAVLINSIRGTSPTSSGTAPQAPGLVRIPAQATGQVTPRVKPLGVTPGIWKK
eukprot:TRINITY_DN29494_c0_g1_i1.p1 TRINITY_DN29494_c0_g1~~TRINITY_DN29494_c0_g1_i1.p1  ORF type:complete len:472 (+),score=94.03 TRINITY_DN29494_c0_g1_i1:180-1418(+)